VKLVRERLAESVAAFRGNFANPQLRRIQLAGLGSVMGLWAYSVALAVYAYDSGGAKAVGIVTLVRAIPAALSAPFTSTLADRLPRVPFMVATNLGRAASIGAAGAVAVAGGASWLVYALAGLASILGTAFLPAESALLPHLARTPDELTAANVVRSTIESVGTFAGPAIGGALLAVTTPGTVMLITAAAFVWGAALVSLIRVRDAGAEERAHEPQPAGAFRREVTAGFGAIVRDRRLRVVVGLYAAQTLLAGALGVLVVVIALDLLSWNDSGVGLLNAAMGVGGVAGSLAAFALIGRKRLASDFGLGIVLWGAPLAAIGLWPHAWVALVALGVLGLGNTLVDVAGMTLLQRLAAEEVIGRVFGAFESVVLVAMGAGSLLAPLLDSALGTRGAVLVAGAILPLALVPLAAPLFAVDGRAAGPVERVELLRALAIFAPLGLPELERLAGAAVDVNVQAGAAVVSEGDEGDRFYVISEGRAEVEAGGRRLRELERGDFFGEIALLRDVPRTATVRALTPLRLLALDREPFLQTVTGHAASAELARDVVAARLRAPVGS